jgi:hypothetical protein
MPATWREFYRIYLKKQAKNEQTDKFNLIVDFLSIFPKLTAVNSNQSMVLNSFQPKI